MAMVGKGGGVDLERGIDFGDVDWGE